MSRLLWVLGLLAGSFSALAQNSTLPPGTSGNEPPTAVHEASPLNLAESKLETEDYAGARALLLPYVSAHPTDARALYDLGYAEDASGNASEAEGSYRKAVDVNPTQFEAHAALGRLLARAGKTADAAKELETAARLTPNPPNPEAEAQSNRTLARLLEPTDADRARRALIAALRTTPETPEDTLLAAEIASRLGEPDAAADAYGRALASAPTHSPVQGEAAAGLAHLLIEGKRWAEAEPVLRKALVENPTDPALNTELAEVLSAENKPADAVAVLENLHAAKPDDAGIATMLADLYTQTGSPAKAAPLYETALKAHPHDPALLAGQGDALVRAGRFGQAIPVLQEATGLDPKNGNAWGSLAFAASQTHQPALVLQALAMRSKVMPDTAPTYFLSATAYDTLHQTKHAAELYRQFLSVAGTGYPDEVWQARHRLVALSK